MTRTCCRGHHNERGSSKETEMSKIQELRQRIKNGEIKVGKGSSGPKVGEGKFTVSIEEAIFGKGENGNERGMITVKVISSEDGDVGVIGGQFKLYEQTKNTEFMEKSIAVWVEILTALGVDEDKIYDDAETLVDVIQNIITLIGKLVRKNPVFLFINRVAQKNLDAKGNARFYNNIWMNESIAANTPQETEGEGESEGDDEPPFEEEVTDKKVASEVKKETQQPKTTSKPWLKK